MSRCEILASGGDETHAEGHPVYEEEHCAVRGLCRGSRDSGAGAAGRSLRRILRLADAVLPVPDAGGGLRPAGYQVFYHSRPAHRPPDRQPAGVGAGAGVYHLSGQHAHRQRHGAHHLPAAGLLRPLHGPAGTVHGLCVHPAEHLRQSGRNADALRQPAESLPLLLFQHPHRGVHTHYAPALPAGRGAADALLSGAPAGKAYHPGRLCRAAEPPADSASTCCSSACR